LLPPHKMVIIMKKLFPCFTDKMDYLFKDIVASLGQLPFEQRSFLFDGEDDTDMEWVLSIAGYITMEYIKYSFDYDIRFNGF